MEGVRERERARERERESQKQAGAGPQGSSKMFQGVSYEFPKFPEFPTKAFLLSFVAQALMRWSLERTEEILFSPSSSSWNSRWLEILNDADREGDWAEGWRKAAYFRLCSGRVQIAFAF